MEGAPANRAIRIEGLTHCPPLHATHLTGTVSELRGLSCERPLSTTNEWAGQRNFLAACFIFSSPVLCLRPIYYIDLFRLTVILFGRYHWQMVTTKKFPSRRHVFPVHLPVFSRFTLAVIAWHEPLPCLACNYIIIVIILFCFVFLGGGGRVGAQVSCRSYVGSAYRMRSLAVNRP